MEYIEKKGDIYFAKSGEIKLDNKNTFYSRCNVVGQKNNPQSFRINDYTINGILILVMEDYPLVMW